MVTGETVKGWFTRFVGDITEPSLVLLANHRGR